MLKRAFFLLLPSVLVLVAADPVRAPAKDETELKIGFVPGPSWRIPVLHKRSVG